MSTMPSRPGSVATLVFSLLALGLCTQPARAQYFGQNKVRYETPRFQVLKTDHFDIYYSAEEQGIIDEAGAISERWYDRLSKALNHQLSRRQVLILYPSHSAFEQTNAVAGDLGEGVGGVTESFKRRIVLPVGSSFAETDHVIGHELVHGFQYDIAGQGRAAGVVPQGIERLPLWFIEGQAEYLSIGPDDPHTAMWMRDAVANKKLPNYGKLADPRYFPYRFGQALWAYVASRYGEEAVGRTLKSAGSAGDASLAIKTALATTPDSLIADWHRATQEWSKPVLAATEPAAKQATPVIVEKHGTGHLNLSPSLSPDGSQVVFLSERSRFAIEMYLADATTGRIQRQITKTVVDPHFQSLGFIASAGDWNPDGRQFAFGGVSRGRPVLSILDTKTGRMVREKRFEDLGEIFSPNWSPDGKRIVFSALANGVTDLWIFDPTNGEKRRLTDGRSADLQPAWSPDGKTIAFVTDRPNGRDGADSADASGHRYGTYRLAIVDVESGMIRMVHGFAGAKHIDPHWSSDGASLFFVSDRGGISDLYRITLATGETTQLTHLTTGVSGLTPLSPAFSLARSAERIVFSAYENGSYNLYRLEGAAALAGGALRAPVSDAVGLLPAATRATLSTLVPPPATVRMDTMTFRRVPYRSSLSLDNVSQASFGIGGGANGTQLSGGASFYWSDMLGDHNLATALQFMNAGGSFLNNTGAVVAYSNLKSRWEWGAEMTQIPYVTSGFTEDFGPPIISGGPPSVVDSIFRFWEIDRSALAQVAYPFDRFRRFEFFGGLRNISFASEVETRTFDINGVLFDDHTNPLSSPPSLTLGTFGAALVSDNSVFGGTGPVLGQRYRFEVDPVVGTLNFTEVLGDFRRYIMLGRSLTLAGRLLHFGRYGDGGEDSRLSPLFIGYPSLVRGYDSGSFVTNEGVFDHLLGSRIGVGNVELRVPLLGSLGVIPTPGVPPLDAAFFYDAGSAWNNGQKPSFLGGDARTVTSYGAALRLNLFGFAVGEVDLVHPNDRPEKGWYWELSIQPGF
jgi:hypothetical protein